MVYTLNGNLKRWAEQCETAEFIKVDPVQIPHRYFNVPGKCSPYGLRNVEISAFVTAWIAWGNRKQIIKKADFIDREIFKGAPYHYIVGKDTQGAAPEWKQYKGSTESFYQTFTFGDFHDLCERLCDVYTVYENMEAAINNTHNGEKPLETLLALFGSVNGIPDIETRTACARLCLFLRWMCRKGSSVDFGLWDVCEPRNLIIPLDTQVHKQAIRLGLTTRRTPDLKTAIQITDCFAKIFPDDPAKGSFSLFGYGINKSMAGSIKDVTVAINEFTEAQKGMVETSKHLAIVESELERISEQPIEKKIEGMSIADVLKLPLFFNNVSIELKSIWGDRETARKQAKQEGMRLKSHPIDSLHVAGILEPGQFIVTFAEILDKVNTGMPRAQRDVVKTLGITAFKKTVQELLDNEKKRNNSDGNDKQ